MGLQYPKTKMFKTFNFQLLTFNFWRRQNGQALIELLVTLALAALLLPGLITGLVASRQGKAQQTQRLAATALLKEGQEAIRTVREATWSAVLTDGTYHPQIAGNTWSLANGSEQVNGYTRQIVISDVLRDANGNIVTIGGTIDPSTKKAVVTVSWGTPFAANVNSTTYLTRYLNNSALTQTTVADFTAGNPSNTVITNHSGGEVTLGAGGGGGDWCNPTLSITTVDLSRQGVPTAISAFQGNIVTGTGGNASGPTFVDIKVAGNGPPIATISGQFNNSKANGVFTETNYGYIATTSNSEEIQILDLTQYSDPPANTKFKEVGYFNAPGNGQGDSVYVVGNVGYMTDGNHFYTFDMASHTGSRPQLNTSTNWTLAGTGKKVVVVGNYAYVAVNSTSTQLQIIDVTNAASPSIVASAATGNSQAGVDLSMNSTGTRAYLVTDYAASSQPDFFIIDTSTKSGSRPLIGSGFNTNVMSPKGVSVATGNRAIIVGTGGTKQYQVVNIANESAPTLCASLAITNGAYAIASVLQSDNYAYSYIVTGDANAELKMILGGAGGQFSTSGTFTSNAFDAGATVAYNRLITNFSQPDQTTIQFQVAVAAAVSGSCNGATYYFVGPDANPTTYFTSSGPIPFATNAQGYSNPGQCLKYKASFSTNDITAAPVLYDVSVNYSP